jgi:hypothetical protein
MRKKMSLSMNSLLSLIEQYEVFMNDLIKYSMVVGNVFKDWMGIDCKLCVVLIHLSYQHKTKGDTYVPSGITKKEAIKVCEAIWIIYESVCREAGLKFVPCVKGLSTILSRGNSLSKG